MDARVDETAQVIILGKFENNKKYKEQILKEILAVICAMFNSDGGKVVIYFEIDPNIPVGGSPFSKITFVIRILEQSLISIVGLNQTVRKINFIDAKESITILIEKINYLITTNYNIYLPSRTQVVQVQPLEHPEKVVDDIINRKIVKEPVQCRKDCQNFFKEKCCGFHENKTHMFKQLKAEQSKRTRLADRMTGKGNKFSCYVSAFANYRGGHLYFGIKDDGFIEGEEILNDDISDIIKKVEKAINKMIWPEEIGQPKRGEHWEIFFEPVLDENAKHIPSTFVIVIYIAPCLGGVFTEEPECYEMVEGIVEKMSFKTWKERILHPVWLHCKEITSSVQRITWASSKVRDAFTQADKVLMKIINNAHWALVPAQCQTLQKKNHSCVMKLLVLSKQVTTCCRRGQLRNAGKHIIDYEKILPEAQDRLFFEVMGLYLHAALERARGNLMKLKEFLAEALSKAELIEAGLVTAIVYIFGGTVTDLLNSENESREFSPHILSVKALEHLRCIPDSCKVGADMEKKAYITLATFYLGCNISGQRIKDCINTSDIDNAKVCMTAIQKSVNDGYPLTNYHEVQFTLVQSICNYRQSQINTNDKLHFLQNASNYAQKAKHIAQEYDFSEILEWSKTNEALCTEELVRAKFALIHSVRK